MISSCFREIAESWAAQARGESKTLENAAQHEDEKVKESKWEMKMHKWVFWGIRVLDFRLNCAKWVF